MNCGIESLRRFVIFWGFVMGSFGLGVIWSTDDNALTIVNKATDQIASSAATSAPLGVFIVIIGFVMSSGVMRKNFCLIEIVTLGIFTLGVVALQVAVYTFAIRPLQNADEKTIDEFYSNNVFKSYWDDKEDRNVVDQVQSKFHCCGLNSPSDWTNSSIFPAGERQIPWSCCHKAKEADDCPESSAFEKGCMSKIIDSFHTFVYGLGTMVLSSAGVNLLGVVLLFSLAYAINNRPDYEDLDDQRADSDSSSD